MAFYAAMLTGMVSCGNSETHQPKESIDEDHMQHDHAEYICPMKCEGDNTYHEPGNCPECGMKMVTLEEMKKMHQEDHDHESEMHNNQE